MQVWVAAIQLWQLLSRGFDRLTGWLQSVTQSGLGLLQTDDDRIAIPSVSSLSQVSHQGSFQKLQQEALLSYTHVYAALTLLSFLA